MDKFEQHINRMKGLRDVYEAGTGQHNILSMLITECEIALRQPPVIGSVCDGCGSKFDAMDIKVGVCYCCQKEIKQTDL